MVHWEDEISEIMARKEGEELQELKQRFKD